MVVPIIPMPITINIPPVDLKNIIDKTVEFVNKGGSAFEATIVQKGKDNPTFGFIKPGHPFHNYYRWKLSELKAASAPPVAPPAPADKAPEPAEAPKPIVAAPTVVSKVAAPPPKLIKPSHSEPPPPLEFYLNLPNISAQELDIMRLTAQFVARNGQAFHHGLLNRENRNPQFDFLKHNHPLNIIFSAYVNCYSRVLLPSRDTIEKLKTPQYREKAAILERAVSHMEWEQGQERARKQAEEEEDNERLAMALIDWHDFVIVETIEPFDGETDLPPPATEDQLLAGIMPAAPEVVDIAPVEAEMETDEMEMEADMEEEEQPAGPAPSATPRPAAVEIEEAPSSPIIPEEPATVPLPPPDTKLKILKEPIKRPDTSKKNAMMMVCPRCNQLVREDEYNEHMRIELLDPKFSKMQRELEQRRKDAFAPSNSDSFGNLSKLAKHRSDIFGGAETEIGKVVGEEGKAAPEKVIWDGHSGSIPRTTSAALAGASLQEPVLSASGGSEKPSIGPHSVSNPSVSAVPMRQPIITVVGGSSSVPRPVIAPVVSAPLMGMPPGMMPPMMPYGVPPHMVPGMMPIPGMFAYGAPPPGMHIPPPPEDEPNSKRQKIEELNLIPEEKFLADYPSAIDLLVQVPSAPSDKNEWNFQGQQIPMTFQPTATIQAVKDRIKEELGMPPNKQKLKTPHISILKDNLSLAYYNITPGTLLVLGAKERGGRKK